MGLTSKSQSIFDQLKDIRTYLIKIGPERRKGECLDKKISEANEIYKQLGDIVSQFNSRVNEFSDEKYNKLKNLIDNIKKVYTEILDFTKVKYVRIKNTLEISEIEVSESLLEHVKEHPNLELVSDLYEIEFDEEGNFAK